MTNVTGKNLYIQTNAFKNNQTIVNIDLCNVPYTNNNMSNAFYYCNNLKTVLNINQNVTNMAYTFYYCYKLVNAPIIPNSVTTLSGTFMYCNGLVNAPVIPNSVTNMHYTFHSCTSLVNAPIIPNSVTAISLCFYKCHSLINAPIIPNSVTIMYQAFQECNNLISMPEIPNSVSSLLCSFGDCEKLTTVTNIPESITTMNQTFYNCKNISGNIYIYSNQIVNADNCFYNTSLRKNVYIPFTYDNGVNTLTYNSFINAGYKTDGSVNGVYLMDIYTSVTINPTPADASVSMYSHMKGSGVDLSNWTYTNDSYNNYELQTYTGSSNNVVLPTKYTNTKSLKTDEGDVVEYIVSKQGYKTITGSVEVDESKIIDVVLDGTVTYTITPIPYDATVTLSASGYTQEGNSITVPTGTEVSYTVSRQCHITQSGTLQSDTDISRYITLPYEYYTFTINCNEEDADIEILVNGKLVNATNNNWIISADNYNNDIELQEYIGSDTNVVMPTNYNVNNSVSVTYKDVITYSVSKPEFNRVTGTEMLTADKTIYVEITDEHELDIVDYIYTNVNRHLELNKYIGSNSDVVIPNAEW